jgi:hypothetical protein
MFDEIIDALLVGSMIEDMPRLIEWISRNDGIGIKSHCTCDVVRMRGKEITTKDRFRPIKILYMVVR